MSSTTMMTRMPIDEEAILLSLTKRMKLNSNFEEMKETVSRVNMNSKESLSYVLPSLSQENINDLFHSGFKVQAQNSTLTEKRAGRKRNYTEMTFGSVISQAKHNENLIRNDIGNSHDNESHNHNDHKIDTMIHQMLKINSKESLKNYLKSKLDEDIRLSHTKSYLNHLQEKVQIIEPQIKSGIENANELKKTLIVTKSAKEKEANRSFVKFELSKKAKELLMKVSSLKNQIAIEKRSADEYKRMLLDLQQAL